MFRWELLCSFNFWFQKSHFVQSIKNVYLKTFLEIKCQQKINHLPRFWLGNFLKLEQEKHIFCHYDIGRVLLYFKFARWQLKWIINKLDVRQGKTITKLFIQSPKKCDFVSLAILICKIKKSRGEKKKKNKSRLPKSETWVSGYRGTFCQCSSRK